MSPERLEKNTIIGEMYWTGETQIGTELQRKIVERFVLKEDPNMMARPVLAMVITDGDVSIIRYFF